MNQQQNGIDVWPLLGHACQPDLFTDMEGMVNKATGRCLVPSI